MPGPFPATMLKLEDVFRIKGVGSCVWCVKGKGREGAGGDGCKFSGCPNLFVVRMVACAGQKW